MQRSLHSNSDNATSETLCTNILVTLQRQKHMMMYNFSRRGVTSDKLWCTLSALMDLSYSAVSWGGVVHF